MKKLPPKKIICFDFDGTLVNSMGRLTDIAERVLSHFFALDPRVARRLYTETSGLPFPQQLEVLYPEAVEKRALAAAAFEKEKRAGYMEEPLYPDTLETLALLRSKNYHIVISSNSEQDLVTKLVTKLALRPDLALGFDLPMEKGRPHFQRILQHLGGTETDLVFIGDSIKDGERALENGVDFIGKTGTFSRNDFTRHFPKAPVITTLAELENIFYG